MCPLLGTWPATQACALSGNGTSDPLVHRLALNPVSHTSQGISQSFWMWQPHSTRAHSIASTAPHRLVQWKRHCSCVHTPVCSPWLPGHIDVVQTVLFIITMAGLFLDWPLYCYNCSILLSVIGINLLLCLIYKLNFHTYVRLGKNIAYRGVSTLWASRHPWGVLEHVPPQE